jgi:hypothetical protein
LQACNKTESDDVRYDLGQSSQKDYRYLHDVVLVPDLAQPYQFSSGGMELRQPISNSFSVPANFDPGGSDMSTVMTGTDFLGVTSTNQISNRELHQTSKLAKGPASEHYTDASSAKSTPVLGSESLGDGASTAPLMSPSNFIEQSSFFAEFAIESEHEMAFLVRHFSEVIAPWYASSKMACFRMPITEHLSGLICSTSPHTSADMCH